MIQLERSVWRTIGVLFVVTYALQAVAIGRGGVESPEFSLWVGVSMFLPGIAALVHLKRSGEGWRVIPWRLGSVGYLALGATLPALLTLVGLAVFEGSGLGMQMALDFDDEGRIVTGLPLLFRGEAMTRPHFALSVLATGVVFSAVTGLMTVGEEVGWRGFLQGKLLERNGLFVSVVFLGLLWALWHAPLVLAGFNYPRTPVLGAFVLFPLAGVGVSGWLAWLTLRARSVWPAVLFHAGVNSVGTLVFEMDFGERDLVGQFAISLGLLGSGLAAVRFGVRGVDLPGAPADS